MENIYAPLEHLHSVYPYTVEFVVFPFWSLASKKESPSCEHLHTKGGRNKIHMMKELTWEEPDPVLSYFIEKFGMDTITEEKPTYFLVTPEGTLAEAYFDASVEDIHNAIERHLHDDLAGRQKAVYHL